MSEPTLICRLLTTLDPQASGPSDAELLSRFAAARDQGAFELLVWRHLALVLRVCRGVLRDSHAAEDAAQATFLALARQADTVGRGYSAAGWLFRVARRIAYRAARVEHRLTTRTGLDLDQLTSPVLAPDRDDDEERVLHEELARLPEAYRSPILLCYFLGLTHAEAARRLGWPVGTVAGRLSRARQLLAERLTRRGVGLAALAAVPAGVVSPIFAANTTQAALAFGLRAKTGVSDHVLELANREVRAMLTTKVARGAIGLAACLTVALGAVWATDSPPQAPPATERTAAPVPKAKADIPKATIGKTFAIAPVTTDLQRRLLYAGGKGSAGVVFVNGSGLFSNPKVLDLDALELKDIRIALKDYRPGPDRTIHFVTNYRQATDLHREGTELLRYGLEGLGRSIGFGKAIAMDRHGFDEWGGWIAPLKDDKGRDAEESAIGDERVAAYRVRTPLSRVLTLSADAIIDVREKLAPQGENWIPADVEKSANAAIAALKLPKGATVNFFFYLQIPENAVRHSDEAIKSIQKLGRRWAEENGLKYGSVTY